MLTVPSCRAFIVAAAIAMPAAAAAQAQDRPPRVFPQFDGTWVLDPSAPNSRIRPNAAVARTIDIVTSPTGVVVMKDGAPGEAYRFDNKPPDLPTGAVASFSHVLTLVADMLALTETRSGTRDNRMYTNVATDAYAVSGDVLTVERQLSVLVEPPGTLVTFEDPGNYRQTFVYRRLREAVGPSPP